MNLNDISLLNDSINLADIGENLATMVSDGLILVVMTLGLSWVYTKTAQTLSNRKRLARIFPLISLTTMMIIGVIKSSLALSLGLVGALSIVRFRAAIKEPEELAYIFLSIGLGLGMGAGQQAITIAFFILVMTYVGVRHVLQTKVNVLQAQTDDTLYLNIKLAQADIELEKIVKVIETQCFYVELKRIDVQRHGQQSGQQLMFVIKTKDYENLANLKQKLTKLDEKVELSILNDERLFA